MSATIVQFAPRAGRPAADRAPPLSFEKLGEQFASLSPEHKQAVLAEIASMRQAKAAAARVANSKGQCKQRDERFEAFRKARAKLGFLERLRELVMHASFAVDQECDGIPEAKTCADIWQQDRDHRLLGRVREARAEWLLTPASTRVELKSKQHLRASGEFKMLDVDVAAVDRLLAADDAWLKANAPVRHEAGQRS